LARVAQQSVHFGRAEMARIDGHDATPLRVITALIYSLAFPADWHAELFRRGDDEFTHRMLLAGGDHEILGFFLLQHQPLRFHILTGMTPVPPRVEIPE